MESCCTIMAKYKPYLNGIDKKTNITPSDCIAELTKSGEFIEYGQGFHSVRCISSDFVSLCNSIADYVMVKCTIPAGSEYVIEGNEIVSNQIIIDEIF